MVRVLKALVASLVSVVLAAVMVVTGAASAHATQVGVVDYTVAGLYNWTVPAGVDTVVFDAYGAEGGTYTDAEGTPFLGGAGGHVRATFTVRAGDTYGIGVAGEGGDAHAAQGCTGAGGAGGYLNGGRGGDGIGSYWEGCTPGAGGGGESIVLFGGNTLANRVLAAAGGGGAGGSSRGGDGGGPVGGPGLFADVNPSSGGGTQTAGGDPGWDYGTDESGADEGATSGSAGNGGRGGSVGGFDHAAGGGGGGGGWYGGGGACANCAGGGGSSWTAASAAGVANEADIRRGGGRVTITYGAYQVPAFTTSTLPQAAAGQPYTSQIGMSGFPAPDAVLGGGSTLPAGLTLRADGTISGTTTAAGTWTFDVGATNAYGFASSEFTLTVKPGAPAILEGSAPMTTKTGSPYPGHVTAHLTDTYGNPLAGLPINFSLPASGPSGVFQAGGANWTNVLTGTDGTADAGVVVAGPYEGSYDVFVTGAGYGTTFTLTATQGPPVFVEPTLPPAGVHEPYSHQIAITGNPRVRLTAGALPPGLALAGNGTLSGTPTAVGKYSFTLLAKNAEGKSKRRIKLAVLAPAKVGVEENTVTEGSGGSIFGTGVALTLSRPSVNPVTVTYRTSDGTATAGIDYLRATGTVTFSPGETRVFAGISVVSDDTPELDETVVVRLSSPQNATIGHGTGTLTIANDD